jgi:hypothetical protein
MFDWSSDSASKIGLLKYFRLSGKTIVQDGLIVIWPMPESVWVVESCVS